MQIYNFFLNCAKRKIKIQKKGLKLRPLFVEYIGVEPMTSCMPCKRSSLLS